MVQTYEKDWTVIFTGLIPILNFPLKEFLTYVLYAALPLTDFLVETFQTNAEYVPYASVGVDFLPFVLNTPTELSLTTVFPKIFFSFSVEVIVWLYVALVFVGESLFVSASRIRFSLTGIVTVSPDFYCFHVT